MLSLQLRQQEVRASHGDDDREQSLEHDAAGIPAADLGSQQVATIYNGKGPGSEREVDLRAMLCKASRLHQCWTVDIRYLDHGLDAEGKVYCISMLEEDSRAILASDFSRWQHPTAHLIVLYAAIRLHSVPVALVNDGGALFCAKQAQYVYDLLGIRKKRMSGTVRWRSSAGCTAGR